MKHENLARIGQLTVGYDAALRALTPQLVATQQGTMAMGPAGMPIPIPAESTALMLAGQRLEFETEAEAQALLKKVEEPLEKARTAITATASKHLAALVGA